MSEKEFYENLGKKVAGLTQIDSVFSGILKVSSTFTPEDLSKHAANGLESFFRGQVRDGVLTEREADQLYDSQIDKDALNAEQRERYEAALEKAGAARTRILASLFAAQQAGRISETIHAKLRAKVEENDTFVSLGEGRFTTREVLRQEDEILAIASGMKENEGNPAAAQAACAVAAERGHAAFFEFPSSNEDFDQAGKNTQTILSFSDIGILNGPPGTGKSTICQSVVFTMLQDETHTLLPEGAAVYATSSNPKAADALGADLLNGLLIQDPPEPPKEPENAFGDERATYELEKKEYDHTAARRSNAIYAVAKGLGKKYADMSNLDYTSANIDSMLSDLEGFMDSLTTDDARRRLQKRIEKLKKKYETLKKEKGKKSVDKDGKETYTLDPVPVNDEDFHAFKKDLYDAYIQGAYNSQKGKEQQAKVKKASFNDLIKAMNNNEVAAGSYIVVDEAGLMGREDMHSLMTASKKAKVRLLLVGDNKQIPPQEAGHPFDLIVGKIAEKDGKEDATCSLTTKKILRQNSPDEKKAGIEIRNGIATRDPRTGIYVYETQAYNGGTQKAVSFIKSDEQATSALIQDYLQFVRDNTTIDEKKNPPQKESGHKKAVVLTTTQEKADKLNESLREQMKKDGMLTPPFVRYGDLEMGTDDNVIFTQDAKFVQNGKTVGISAGETATCVTDPKNPNQVVLKFSGDKSVTIDVTDKSNLAAFDGAHSAFALPLALAQGMSKNRAFLSLTAGDKLDGPNGLVAFTRHKKQMSAYISQEAYGNMDALAADIKKFPKGMNAHDYLNGNEGESKPLSTIQMVGKAQKSNTLSTVKMAQKRFNIEKNKSAYKQASAEKTQKKKDNFFAKLKDKLQKTQ